MSVRSDDLFDRVQSSRCAVTEKRDSSSVYLSHMWNLNYFNSNGIMLPSPISRCERGEIILTRVYLTVWQLKYRSFGLPNGSNSSVLVEEEMMVGPVISDLRASLLC